MDFNEYQRKARTVAIYMDGFMEEFPNLPDGVYKIVALSYVATGLGEVGEIQGKVKKIIRDTRGILSDQQKKDLSKELGDVMWYVSNMCSELGLDLEKVAEENIEKLLSRKDRGKLKGSGDDR